MNAFRILTTVFGLCSCAALVWAGAQVGVLPRGEPMMVAAVVGLWASAGVLGFVLVRTASGGSGLAYLCFVALYLGAVASAVMSGRELALAYGPTVIVAVCLTLCIGLSSYSATTRSDTEPDERHRVPNTTPNVSPGSSRWQRLSNASKPH